jgi:hypothetical protein
MLAPERLVLTPSPANLERISTKFDVEVVLPLVPETKTMSRLIARLLIASGQIAKITRPVKVSPRPRLKLREIKPAMFPRLIAIFNRGE